MRVTPKDRDELILKLRQEGKTLQAIGDIFGITRERVRQILVKVLDKKPARV